jgi:hypothetical protein
MGATDLLCAAIAAVENHKLDRSDPRSMPAAGLGKVWIN